jgi:Uma2 family endonuclease
MRATPVEFMSLPEGALAEYIGGEILMSPSPRARRQKLVFRIRAALDAFVAARRLGQTFEAPLDVHLPSGDVVQPDVLFVSAARGSLVQDWVRGSPDLVVEALSPESRRRDLEVKADLYAREGVGEAWFADPDAGTIDVRRAEGVFRFGPGGALVSRLLPGFELPLADLFRP